MTYVPLVTHVTHVTHVPLVTHLTHVTHMNPMTRLDKYDQVTESMNGQYPRSYVHYMMILLNMRVNIEEKPIILWYLNIVVVTLGLEYIIKGPPCARVPEGGSHAL